MVCGDLRTYTPIHLLIQYRPETGEHHTAHNRPLIHIKYELHSIIRGKTWTEICFKKEPIYKVSTVTGLCFSLPSLAARPRPRRTPSPQLLLILQTELN
jgi:hypothetical protein